MPDEPENQDPEGDGGDLQDPPLSRRERARLAEQDETIRNLTLGGLVRDAGLNPNEGPGRLFVEGYKGELTADAVKTGIEGYGISPKPPEPTDPPKDGSHIPDEEKRGTGERQDAAAGAQAESEPPSEDPRITAVKVGQAVMAAGGTEEAAMGEAFDVIAEAGFKRHDPRAIFDGANKDRDPHRPDLGW